MSLMPDWKPVPRISPWSSLLKDVVPVVKDALEQRWTWYRNRRCKYITVRIDMRDGHCIIMDRDGNRIDPKDLSFQDKKQYKSEVKT